MICPYCNTRNPDEAEICVFCRQRFEDYVDFDSVLNKLTELGNRVVRREIPADPSQFQREFDMIEKEMQSLIDKATRIIENNVKDIERLKNETSQKLGDLNVDTFNRILNNFDKAQKQITRGLGDVKSSIIDAKSSDEITVGLSQYSSAMADISEGSSGIEMVTSESGDFKTLTNPPEYSDYPYELIYIQAELEKAIRSIEEFKEKEDLDLLLFSIIKTERAHDELLELLEEYESVLERGEEISIEYEDEEDYDEDEYDEEIEDYYEDYDEEIEIDEETEDIEDMDEEEYISLIYRDIDDIVSDEDIEELLSPPVVDSLDQIYKDEDWIALKKEMEPETPGEQVKPEIPEKEKAEVEKTEDKSELVESISALVSVTKSEEE